MIYSFIYIENRHAANAENKNIFKHDNTQKVKIKVKVWALAIALMT